MIRGAPAAAMALAVWAAAVPAGAGAAGRWLPRESAYVDELDDVAGLDAALLQAIAVSGGEAGIPPAWRVSYPAAGADPTLATGVDFSVAGSSTFFTAIPTLTVTGGAGLERVELLQKWFSAVEDMNWRLNCKWGQEVANDPAHSQCLLFPVDAATGDTREASRGARSARVLDCPDVRNFNQCQTKICGQGGCKTNCPGAEGDYILVALNINHRDYRDLLVAGENYAATWFVRSPGRHDVPPLGSSAFNDRLLSFEMSFSYTNDGGVWIANNYLGGAVPVCSDPTMGLDCLLPQLGCPVRIELGANPPPRINAATLYMQSSAADSVYTAYTFSFCAGALATAPPYGLRCHACGEKFSGFQMSNSALCSPNPDGAWRFALRTDGGAGMGNTDTNPSPSNCPATPPGGCASANPVPCWNDRASASLYVDGLMLTAMTGRYTSRPFDALSPLTRWTVLGWDTSTHPDASGLPRTGVEIGWRAAPEAAGLAALRWTARPATTVETDSAPLPVPQGRYFQFTATLTGWEESDVSPPPPASPGFCSTCLRFGIGHDGSLSPTIRRVSLAYQPFAGRFVSLPVRPVRMKRWKAFRYETAGVAGGASVTADLGVVEDGVFRVVLAGAADGAPLGAIDPGASPALAARFTLDKGTDASANPRVRWFRLEYEPMTECLALNRNVIRQARAEGVDVRYCVEATGRVVLRVHDGAGQLVRTLLDRERPAGEVYQEHWDGTGETGAPVAPGVYFITAATPTATVTKRVAVGR